MEKQFEFDSRYLKQLELLRLDSRKKYLGSRQGGHHSLKKGHGIEFSDYRQYELGDNPRYIDWKLYARSDKLYLKRFQEEQEITISILLDASASMGFETDPEKWNLACRIALSFGYLGLIQQDRVKLSFLGSRQKILGSTAQEFLALRNFTQNFKPDTTQNSNLASSLRQAAIDSKFPGIAIVISDFFEPLEEIDRAFNFLRSRNLQIVAIQILGKKDFSPINQSEYGDLIDAESNEHFELEMTAEESERLKEKIESHTRIINDYFKRKQIGFISIKDGQDILQTLIKGKQSLGIIK